MKKLIILSTVLLFANPLLAVERSEFSYARRGVATVMLAGIGGAVVGMSSLSFYGKPEEHTGNIYFGLAAGLIGGAVYVLITPEAERSWTSLTKPNQREEFSKPVGIPIAKNSVPTYLNWGFEF